MEYQIIINLLDKINNQPPKFRTKTDLRSIMMHVEHAAQKVKSISKPQC